MPIKRSVVLCKWCKSVYVKEAAKHAKAYFSKENDTCDHHITRILSINGWLLCIGASSYFFTGKYTLK